MVPTPKQVSLKNRHNICFQSWGQTGIFTKKIVVAYDLLMNEKG